MIGQNPRVEFLVLGLLYVAVSLWWMWENLPSVSGCLLANGFKRAADWVFLLQLWRQRRHRRRMQEAFQKSYRQHRMALDTLQIEAEKREQKSKR